MALRERLVRESGMTGPLSEDAISNQQGFQDMKSRLHRMLINRMDLTKLGQLEPDQLHEEVARLASSLLAQEDTPLSSVERERLIHEVTTRAVRTWTTRAAARRHVDLRHSRQLSVQHLHRAWRKTRTHQYRV